MTTRRAATLEEMAAIDFEPLSKEHLELAKTPDEAEMLPYLQTLRVAWLLLGKSKSELKEVVAGIDEELGQHMFESFKNTIGELERLSAIMNMAETRLLCAGAALGVEDGRVTL